VSYVKYGDIQMPLVKTNSFAQEPIYTEDGIDYLYTKFTLDCQCLLTYDSLLITPVSHISDLSRQIATLRPQLLQPRQNFRYSVGETGDAVVDIGGPDPAGGPFPQAFDIIEIQGANAAIVSYRIIAYGDVCGENREDEREKEILSNRFSVTTSYDQDFYATRTMTGKLVLRGKKGLQPDDFRNVVMPTLPHGYRRESMSFQVSSNALSLGYTIVDKEKYVIDRVSTTSKGTYNEWTERWGVPVYGEVEISLSAPKNFDKKNMISRAAEIALSRFTEDDHLMSTSVTEDLFSNAISLRMRAMKASGKMTREKNAKFIFGETLGDEIAPPANKIISRLPIQVVRADDKLLRFNDITFPDDLSADLSIRNKKIIRAAIAAWKEPCGGTELPKDRFGPFDQEPPEDDIDDPAPEISFSLIEPDEEQPDPSYSELQKYTKFMFTDAAMEINYDTTTNEIQLPIAGNEVSDDNAMNNEDTKYDENAFVTLSRKQMVKRIDFTVERVGAYPYVPKAVDKYTVPGTKVKARLLKKVIKPISTEIGVDGATRIIRISGTYHYGYSRALRETEKALDTGQLPWINVPETFRIIPTDRYITGITEDG